MLAVGIATLGIPLPVPYVKEIAAMFPCMNCPCGCVNAEVCWRNCCCFTNTEKIAWAEQHGATIPDYVYTQVAEEVGCDVDLAELKPCCRQRVLAAQTKKTCDRSGACDKSDAENKSPLVPGVLAIHALKCQGHSLSISLLPPSIPTDEIGAELPLMPGENFVLVECLLYQPPFFDAVVPPPEFAAL